ncbi:NUDIX domain-containing protein [Halobacteria archaeon AArc-m2/3/4]|uniref:NUDIX domain-containing protein n=1 Tax=Natronoglomus mannanivorans TaxID=2979990 RepID=A0ABT2QB48_9EURY|nr:NUDIX domain-containing protein [Halobacteria archaeon AArc-m2/3/4]
MTESWQRIRPVALGAVRRDDELLVTEGYDPGADERFYRLPGGGVAFGEYAADAVEREFDEEFGVTLTDVSHLGTYEDVFSFDGKRGHEHWWVFEASIVEDWPYERDAFTGYEHAVDEEITAVWKPIADLESAETTFYDECVLEGLGD